MSQMECVVQVKYTLQQRYIPDDIIVHLVLPYLFVLCEKCKADYLTEKTLDDLVLANVDYRQCDSCLQTCKYTHRECFWKGKKEEFSSNGLCPNHVQSEQMEFTTLEQLWSTDYFEFQCPTCRGKDTFILFILISDHFLCTSCKDKRKITCTKCQTHRFLPGKGSKIYPTMCYPCGRSEQAEQIRLAIGIGIVGGVALGSAIHHIRNKKRKYLCT